MAAPPPDIHNAVPLQFRLGSDTWSRLPLALLSYGMCLGDALAPVLPAARMAGTAVSMLFIFGATVDRSRVAGQFQMHPELRRYTSNRIGLESAFREWIACVTVPSILVGTALAASSAIMTKRMPAGHRWLKWGPSVATALLSPAIMAAAGYLTDKVVMDWAFIPMLDAWMPPPAQGRLGAVKDYIAPNAEQVLVEVPRHGTAPGGPPVAQGDAGLDAVDLSVIFGSMDAGTRKCLSWAMDGNSGTPYPEALEAPTAHKGASDGGDAALK